MKLPIDIIVIVSLVGLLLIVLIVIAIVYLARYRKTKDSDNGSRRLASNNYDNVGIDLVCFQIFFQFYL